MSTPKPLAILPSDQLFDENGSIILPTLITHLCNEGRLKNEDVIKIFSQASVLLRLEKNVIFAKDPITVVGDIHGQFFDLIRLFQLAGHPSKQKYLFLGDYVDRGSFGMEVLLLLCSFKIHYPDTFYMLRGNHECRHITAYFNFQTECLFKYDSHVYDSACYVFDSLPLVCILNDRFFCVHAGISPDIMTVSDIDLIDRFREVPSSGPFCDL